MQNRTEFIGARFSEEEKNYIEQFVANHHHRSVSDLLREALFSHVRFLTKNSNRIRSEGIEVDLGVAKESMERLLDWLDYMDALDGMKDTISTIQQEVKRASIIKVKKKLKEELSSKPKKKSRKRKARKEIDVEKARERGKYAYFYAVIEQRRRGG